MGDHGIHLGRLTRLKIIPMHRPWWFLARSETWDLIRSHPVIWQLVFLCVEKKIKKYAASFSLQILSFTHKASILLAVLEFENEFFVVFCLKRTLMKRIFIFRLESIINDTSNSLICNFNNHRVRNIFTELNYYIIPCSIASFLPTGWILSWLAC